MKINLDLKRFRTEQRVAMQLKSLYESYGYIPYRMSKFEEYELYSKNRDFIGESNILTFTDTDGKLMALKPDVTLSIVKNSNGSVGTQKVHYSENVYRASGRGGSYKEIPQSGIECIGDIGGYEIAEVLLLALMSLELTGRPFKLEISHMGILSSLVDELNLNEDDREELFTCIKRKNSDGIREIATRNGFEGEPALASAVALCGNSEDVIARLKDLVPTGVLTYLNELEETLGVLAEFGYSDNVGIDLSVVNDMNYYRSLVFRGYIDCVPEGVLFGGRYDDLVRKMGRDSSAIGFAVMLDKLQELSRNDAQILADILLVYSEKDSVSDVLKKSNELRSNGYTVAALPYVDKRYDDAKVIFMSYSEDENDSEVK